MNVIKAAAIWSSVLALAAGCSSTPVSDPAAGSSKDPVHAAPVQASASVARTASSTVTPVARPGLAAQASTDRSVYFDYDEFEIKPEFLSLLERHGQFLSSHPALAIKIEGNADERGSAEYNLALGQKRAQSVLNTLKIYGVRVSQMEAISWGEERARAKGHDEVAWAQNRRADLAYPR